MYSSKILKFSLITSTLLVLSACGGGSSDEGTSTSTSTNSIVPTTINIDIPSGLKSDRTAIQVPKQTFQELSLQKTSDTIASRGYQQLKITVGEVERNIQEVKENMILTNAMMPAIQTACEGTTINEVCTIPAGVISLTITNSIISGIAAVQNEFGTVDPNSLPPLNFLLTMGQVLYTQFDDTHVYQQDVVLDLQPTFAELGIQITKQLETIRWSEDKNHIETISDIDEPAGKLTMHLTYNKIPNGITSMYVNNSYSLSTGEKGNFSFDMKETNDLVNTVIVDISGSTTANGIAITFKENGEINDNGGFLISKGSFSTSEFAEKETFDKDGNLLKSKFCDTFNPSDTCIITDQATWHTFDEILGIDDNSFAEESFDANNFGDNVDTVFNVQKLIVTGGTLSDGICDLLPSTFDTTNLNQGSSVFENSVGNIFKFETEVEGVLFDSNYLTQLDSLKVVCFDSSSIGLIELTGASRPILTLAPSEITGQ